MKKFTKALAIMLTLVMTASMFCLPVVAEEPQKPEYFDTLKEGIGYVAIGDSFTRGYGATADRNIWLDQIYRGDNYPTSDERNGGTYNRKASFYCRNVENCYPNNVAAYFGLETPDDIRDTTAKMWPVAHDAVSTAYILDLLGIDDGYRDDDFTYQDSSMIGRYKADLKYFGDPESYTLDGTARYGQTGEVMSIRDMLKNASLISLGLGQTDVIYRAQVLAFNPLLADPSAISVESIANLIKVLYEYYDYWIGAYPLLLDFIKENNPDAKVVIVGTMNPIQDITVSDEILAPLGSAINFISDAMNIFLKKCAKEYGYMFVDISGVDTPSAVKQTSLNELMTVIATGDDIDYALIAHPTPSGYQQISRMIINAVEDELKKDAGISTIPNTYIRVDLGDVSKVKTVKLDGKEVKNFKFENHTLTVPYLKSDAKTLTVYAGNSGSSDLTLVSYALVFTGDGYLARRLYKTNNLIDTILVTIKLFFEKISGFFKGLFA